MATEKQIAANQLNALKSTGPRTLEGKEVSSQNAIRHGLSARKAITLQDENEAEFQSLRQSLRDHYAPRSPLDQIFVDTLAANLWRLQRVPKFEAMLLQAAPEVEGDETDPAPSACRAVQQLMALQDFVLPKDVLGKISRYEGHLLRECLRLMTILQQRPAEKAAISAPQPIHPPIQPQRMSSVDEINDRILQSLSQPRHGL